MGLYPAGTPCSWRVIHWLVMRPVIGSRKSTAQPTPRVPPTAMKSAFHVSKLPKVSSRAFVSCALGLPLPFGARFSK